MTVQESDTLTEKESTISRKTRNAFVSAVVFALAAIGNFFVTLRIGIAAKRVIPFIDAGVVFVFIIATIYSAIKIRNGEKRKGVWTLLVTFVITLALRNALTADLGIVFALLAVSVVPLIGLLTLPPSSFNRTLSLGLSASAFYLLFDTLASRYFPPYRQPLETVVGIRNTIAVLATIIVIAYIVALIRQRRFLLLRSKLTLAMIFVVIIPIVLLSVVGDFSLENSFLPRQNEELQDKANFLAQSINRFVANGKNSISVEAQTPSIVNFLTEREIFYFEQQALQTLQAFRRKDILNINSYAILDVSGKNLLDTSAENVGNDEGDTNYFVNAIESKDVYISGIEKKSGEEAYSFFFSVPIESNDGRILGVLRAEYKASVLQDYILDYIRVSSKADRETFAALIAKIEMEQQISPEDPASVFLVLANSQNDELNFKSITPLTTNVITPLQMDRILPVGSTAQLSLETPGLDTGLRNYSEDPVFYAQAFPREEAPQIPLDVITVAEVDEELLPWMVVLSQDLASFQAPFQQQTDINTILAIVIAGLAAVLAYAGSQYLTRPLLQFANAANKISAGDLSARVEVDTEDEVGALGSAFNSMAKQLSTSIETLEQRVDDRTKELQQQALQLQAAVEVGKAAASLRNLDDLLSQATELISRQFGYYHAGIFLLDSQGEYAVLRAANSEGGAKMLAREHKLKVGETGIVGYVTATGEARIALDVGQDAIYFDNPDMPNTRSEMALPLAAGGRILGALDIQSTEGEAFKERDIASLQVLADQIAIAIENARLFEQNRDALIRVQRAYGEQSQLGWQELIHKQKDFGYRSAQDGNIYQVDSEPAETLKVVMKEKEALLTDDQLTVNIPILVRGQAIGAMRLVKPENGRAWNEQELTLAETLTAELSKAMDSARLFDETRQQADRERVVGEISDRMRETMNVESVVRQAADEFYKLLDLDNITINFTADDDTEETV